MLNIQNYSTASLAKHIYFWPLSLSGHANLRPFFKLDPVLKVRIELNNFLIYCTKIVRIFLINLLFGARQVFRCCPYIVTDYVFTDTIYIICPYFPLCTLYPSLFSISCMVLQIFSSSPWVQPSIAMRIVAASYFILPLF